MSDEPVLPDLPRYTWVADYMGVHIMRRTGMFGQEPTLILMLPYGHAKRIDDTLRAAANALCDWLDQHDRRPS